jgi:hypothetical protein
MNRRIEELIDAAKLTAVSEMFEDELVKFAESIVYDFLSELTNDDALGSARIETIRRLAERYGVLNDELES